MTVDRLNSLFLALILLSCLTACAKRSRSLVFVDNQRSAQTQTDLGQSSARININAASGKQLETLPGIGEGLAQRIIEHREKYGRFRRAEHLMMVRGISDKRFRALRDLITVE